MPSGGHDILIKNDPSGVNFTIPVNPQSIKWDGELVTQIHDTKAGFHYQFIKYRRTNGMMNLMTGAARNKTFRLPGGKSKTVNDAYQYMMTFGAIIEYWMRRSVMDNVGPLQLIDNYNPDFPITMDIIFLRFPAFGPEALTTNYPIQLQFEIINDYVDKWDMSETDLDVLPPLARAADAVYITKAGDTVKSIAKKIYGTEDMAMLIKQIGANSSYIRSDGSLKPGMTLVIPYAPADKRYLFSGDAKSDKNQGVQEMASSQEFSNPIGSSFDSLIDSINPFG